MKDTFSPLHCPECGEPSPNGEYHGYCLPFAPTVPVASLARDDICIVCGLERAAHTNGRSEGGVKSHPFEEMP